jgi:hypothetical protein
MLKGGKYMKDKLFISTAIGCIFVLLFSLGIAPHASALNIDWNEWIGKTTEASYEHKDRDVASRTTGVELFYQGPFYNHCDEEEHATSNEPGSSMTLSKVADLSTVNDKNLDSVLVLTLTSLEGLKAEDIPDKSWIDGLKPLTGEEFVGEGVFLDAVAEQIGLEYTVAYGELILAYARVRQADSRATSTVQTTKLGSNKLHFEINLDDVTGNSYYNKTTTHPSNHQLDKDAYELTPEEFEAKYPTLPNYSKDYNGEEILPYKLPKDEFEAKYFPGGFNPDEEEFPDYSQVEEEPYELAYYNNWQMTSADSHAYGGYGGTGNTFVVDDGDNVADEELWVKAVYSYSYDLSGGWTYHTVTNTHHNDDPTDDVTYNERTGHFYTSFTSSLSIGNGDDQFEFDAFDDIWRNDVADIPDTEGTERVLQENSGEFTTTFSFKVTEGIDYTFDMFADVYGYCDGFADYLSSGWATLDLEIMGDMPSAPEPSTILLLSLGLVGILTYRKRFIKR